MSDSSELTETKVGRRWLKRQSKFVVDDKELYKEGRAGDEIIPVMGPTGVGKSTFIKTLLRDVPGAPLVQVGHGLESCTVNLLPIPLNSGPNRTIIVDTPGFDDTHTADSEILRRIAVWLTDCYARGMKLGGIIYMHDITEARVTGTIRLNLELFQKLCGHEALPRVMIVVTKWPDASKEARAKERLEQLRKTFWSDLVNHDARLMIFEHTPKSAKDVLATIQDHSTGAQNLWIQREIAEIGRIIPSTEAGQKLRFQLEDIAKMKLAAKSGPVKDVDLERKRRELMIISNQIQELKGGGLWSRFMNYLDFHLTM